MRMQENWTGQKTFLDYSYVSGMMAYDEHFMDNGPKIQDVNCSSNIELYIYDDVMTWT